MGINMFRPKSRTLVVFSGGFDSASLLLATLALNDMDPKKVVALSFNYGQKHASELTAARTICTQLGIKQHIIDVRNWDMYNSSTCALMRGSSIPITKGKEYSEFTDDCRDDMGAVNTSVPFRNILFSVVATIKAHELGCQYVSLAVHKGDNNAFAYPDCSPKALAPLAEAIYHASNGLIELVAPFIEMQKYEIIQMIQSIDENVRSGLYKKWLEIIALSWSCYDGGEVHCGECATCLERRQAFTRMHIPDPTTYAKSTTVDVGRGLR